MSYTQCEMCFRRLQEQIHASQAEPDPCRAASDLFRRCFEKHPTCSRNCLHQITADAVISPAVYLDKNKLQRLGAWLLHTLKMVCPFE